MLEGSAIYPLWTGDQDFGVCAALCACRWVAVVERGHFLASAAEGRLDGQEGQEHAQEGQDMKVLRRIAIVVCSECGTSMNILEFGVVSLLSSLSS